jgi:cytochrome c oxidase subunit IV
MSQHIVPIKTYVGIFLILMVLMLATVVASGLNLGVFEIPVAMAIAVAKTLLIALYFMHLKFSNRLTWLFAGASVLALAILISFLMVDIGTRGEMRLPVLTTGPTSAASAYFDGPLIPDVVQPLNAAE